MEEPSKQSGPSGQGHGLRLRACVGRGGGGEAGGRSPRAPPCTMPWSVNFSICGGGKLFQVAKALNGEEGCRE